MSDRGNRRAGLLAALVLLGAGGVGLSVSLGAWGRRSPTTLVDPALVRWWRDGGRLSFAALAFIGAVLVVVGLAWAVAQLRSPEPGDAQRFDLAAPGEARGRTSLRAAPLRRALETDLRSIDGVQDASVRLLGKQSDLELRAWVGVDDGADLAALGARIDAAVGRMAHTAGFGPAAIDITLILVFVGSPRVV